MPTLFFADLVRERSTATGASVLSLEGALPGHRRFADAVPPAARFHYSIAGVTHPEQWEVGEGTLDPAGKLVRTPHASSNNGAAVDLLPGLKTIALTVAAPWFAARDSAPTIADVTGLTAALAGKQAAGNYALASHTHAYLPLSGGTLSGSVRIGGGTARAPLDVMGQIAGGFGAQSTAGIEDWNDAANARSGNGLTLLMGMAANGPSDAATSYFHSFSFEYGSKDGSGNLTQLAIPYTTPAGLAAPFLRGRFDGNWSNWRQILVDNGSGQFAPASDNAKALGSASRRFSTIYAASGTIATSDRRAKCAVGEVPERWLDAWGDVGWSRYRMKGGKRWHVGLVAQDVHEAFAARGLDAFELGLLCRDVWAEERAPVISKKTGRPMPRRTRRVRASGERWGLRYDECLALEAAWVRRELDRLGGEVLASQIGTTLHHPPSLGRVEKSKDFSGWVKPPRNALRYPPQKTCRFLTLPRKGRVGRRAAFNALSQPKTSRASTRGSVAIPCRHRPCRPASGWRC